MNLLLNYHHLRYFLGVASEGGIKAASEVLHVSPPTLSAQVRELEEFLGTELFRRENRSLKLTDAGRVVRRYAERIVGLGDELAEVVQRGGVGSPETVYIGIDDAVPKLFATTILGKAWSAMPGLRIVVREGLANELFPALAAHQLDLVISNQAADASLKTPLHSTRTGTYDVHFVAVPELISRYRRSRQLHEFPILLPTRESPLRRELDHWWAKNGVKPEIRAEFDDTATMCEMAAAGVGAAPLLAPVLPKITLRYGLKKLPLRTGLKESLFVVTAEREFSQTGPDLIVRVSGEIP